MSEPKKLRYNDAWMAAEKEYRDAIGRLSAAELEALATRPLVKHCKTNAENPSNSNNPRK